MNKSKQVKPSGQMLIEVVIAVAVIALVLVGVSGLMTKSLRVISFQKEKDQAASLLQKIQNDYRRERDLDADGFFASIGESESVDCGPIYACTVDFDVTVDSVLVTVTATWEDGEDELSVSSEQLLQKNIR